MENAGLGELLKKAREKKELSIDDVVRITRIRKEFLEALEKEDYSKLPERTYALGYFRSYAKFLDIENIEELIKELDKTYYFERPKYSNKKGQAFLDDEYGLVNTIKKKFSHNSNEESEEQKDFELKDISKKTDETLSDKDSLKNKDSKKESTEEGGFSSHNKLIIVLCVFLFVFLFLGYKLLFSGSSEKEDENSVEVATKEISDNKKIDSIINDNYVVVENKDNNKKLQNPPLETKSLQGQEAQPNDNANSTLPYEVNQNNTDASANAETSQEVVVEEKPKVEIKKVNFPETKKKSEISITFAEDVWIQIFKQDDKNTVYVDKIFKAGDIFDIPNVDNIAMNVGNYKGITLVVGNKELELTNPRRGNVLKNIVLDKNTLLETYSPAR
ncbi:MAG: DUF4115 domain-containing protein [Alphaproteobacteria bacterium]|jgi:cytoskeletal protein RodZ|nr:DUF4115 domain-containing protein [Alphaproteobacteria bacterium]